MLQQLNKDNALHTETYQFNQWLDHKFVSDSTDISAQLSLLTKRFENNHKWVLVISNDIHAQRRIQQTPDTNQSNVLWVHSHRVNVSLDNIKNTLMKGNCAAIALCDVELDTNQIEQIAIAANQGNTHCVLLNKETQLH